MPCNVMIFPDGTVSWPPPAKLRSSCQVCTLNGRFHQEYSLFLWFSKTKASLLLSLCFPSLFFKNVLSPFPKPPSRIQSLLLFPQNAICSSGFLRIHFLLLFPRIHFLMNIEPSPSHCIKPFLSGHSVSDCLCLAKFNTGETTM